MKAQPEISIVAMPETFGLLPEPVGRLSSFVESLALNIGIGIALFWFTMTQLHQAHPVPRYVNTELIFPIRPSRVTRIKMPPPHPVMEPRRIELSRPRPEPPKPATLLLTPAMPAIPSAPAKVVVVSPQPRETSFAKRTALEKKPTPQVIKTGGFGDPLGVCGECKWGGW